MLGYILNVNPSGEKKLGFGYRVDPELFRLMTVLNQGDPKAWAGAVCFQRFDWFMASAKERGLWPRIANLVGPDIIALGKPYSEYSRMPVCFYPARKEQTPDWSVMQALPEEVRERGRITARIRKIDTDQHEQFHAAARYIDEEEWTRRVNTDDRARGVVPDFAFAKVQTGAFVEHAASQIADVLVQWQKKRKKAGRSRAAIQARVLRFLTAPGRGFAWAPMRRIDRTNMTPKARQEAVAMRRGVSAAQIPEEWLARVEGYNAARIEAARMKSPAADRTLAITRGAYGGDLFRAFVEGLDDLGLSARDFYRRLVKTFFEISSMAAYRRCHGFNIGDIVSYDPNRVDAKTLSRVEGAYLALGRGRVSSIYSLGDVCFATVFDETPGRGQWGVYNVPTKGLLLIERP